MGGGYCKQFLEDSPHAMLRVALVSLGSTLYYPHAMVLQIGQRRSYSHALGPNVGSTYILGATGMMQSHRDDAQLPRRSKYPIFKGSGSKDHPLYGFWDQSSNIGYLDPLGNTETYQDTAMSVARRSPGVRTVK